MIRVEAWLCLLMGVYGVITGIVGKNLRFYGYTTRQSAGPKTARILFIVAGSILVFLGAHLLRVK